MTEGARTADICTRFNLLVRALVTDRDMVSVTSVNTSAGDPVVLIEVNPQDLNVLLGKDNAVANSLRILLESIGERQGVHYLLSINGDGPHKDLPKLSPDWVSLTRQNIASC